ncbi:hypothetical protein HPB49_002223 [Dermacentor silvarum]|uniref:Uncharacterized protein n=1 Tax=Dermacentor silvarum TaxID=543639 RepID=A0ACB8D9V2_DERSI|nr:hypothetical protein HPB49_002223 [Dermacentor silvarum]
MELGARHGVSKTVTCPRKRFPCTRAKESCGPRASPGPSTLSGCQKQRLRTSEGAVEQLATSLESQVKLEEPAQPPSAACADPAKKLRNLRKKLRDIEQLKRRIESGELANPEPEQLEKVSRQDEIEAQIEELELDGIE